MSVKINLVYASASMYIAVAEGSGQSPSVYSNLLYSTMSNGSINFTFTPTQPNVELSMKLLFNKVPLTAFSYSFTLDTVSYTQQTGANSSTQLVQISNKVGDKYRFGMNGIEKLNELAGIGNHYTALFGEYDPRAVYRWNIDPKPTIGISPYAMFKGNPIWYNDPLLDDPNDPLVDDPSDAPLVDGPNDPIGSFAKLARSVISLYHSAKVIFTVAANVADKINTAAKYVDRNTTPAQKQAGVETAKFFTGFGSQHKNFGPNEPITRDIQASRLTAEARAAFYAQNKDALKNGDWGKVKQIENKVFKFNTGLFTEGGNAQQFVGSATYSISLSSDHKTLNFDVYNETSIKSLLYHLPVDNHTRAQNPIMGTTSQNFEFSEPLKVPNKK